MVYLTKRLHFSASHVLRREALSPEENARLFGKKAAPHGHNYTLEVTVRGAPNPQTGFLIDFERLTEMIDKTILSQVNSRHLDEKLPFLEGANPTAENLACLFWKKLEAALSEGILYEIRLQQGDGESVAYRGE